MVSMKGKISMNQITLNVRLYAEGTDNDILAFMFDDVLKVNLNSDSCHNELKEVFSKLIKLSLENDVTLNLNIDKDYGRTLYKDVCIEYVDELQHELNIVKDKIQKEMAI